MFKRLIDLCFEHPKLFWGILVFGGICDLVFFLGYFEKDQAKRLMIGARYGEKI